MYGNAAKNWTHKTLFLILVEIPKDQEDSVNQSKDPLVQPADKTGEVKANLQGC